MILRLLLPLTALALLGVTAPLPTPTPEQALAARTVQAHVEFLADDRLEGRDTGSRGHEIAANYVASQFRQLGLEPGGPDGSWFQQVPLRRATTVQPTPTIRLTSGGATTDLTWGIDAALTPSLTERRRRIDAGLVFVGYGLDEPLLGIADYRGLDVRSKIVVALSDSPPGLPTEIAAHLQSAKRDTAARHGAIGLIVVSRDPDRTGRQADVAGTARGPVVDWIDRDGGRPADLRARIVLSPAWQVKLFDGAPSTLAAIRSEAKTPAHPRGFALPGRLSLTADTLWQDFASPQPIARLPGADPARAGEHVMLLAHLDHLAPKTDAKPGEDRIYNGALDNAAGVATMLEAARQFVASGRRPARSVLFIAVTGEEKGLLGAGYFAAQPSAAAESVVGVVGLDMPLPLYEFTDVIAFGADRSTLAQAVAEAGRSLNIAVSPDPMPGEAIFTRSDHYKFVLRGVPSILLMTGHANGGAAVWKNFLGKTYHSVGDDLSQPISWRALARYGDLNYRIARTLADAPERPRWYAGDYFGDRFAPGEKRAVGSMGR